MLLSERIRQFSFNLSELHGSKAEAQRFFRGWQAEVAQLEQQVERLEKGLKKIAEMKSDGSAWEGGVMIMIANTALAQQEE